MSNRCWLKYLVVIEAEFCAVIVLQHCYSTALYSEVGLVIILFIPDKTATLTANSDPSNLSQHSTTSTPLFNPSLWSAPSFLLSQFDRFCLHFQTGAENPSLSTAPCLLTSSLTLSHHDQPLLIPLILLFLVNAVVFCCFHGTVIKNNGNTERNKKQD